MALTALQVAAAAYIGGFHGDDVAQATALAQVQSGFNPALVRGDNYGLWQIRKSAHQGLFRDYKWDNPADNARMANTIFQRAGGLLSPTGGWKDWPSHGGPRYKAALPAGKKAWAELKKRLEDGDSPEKILGAERSDGHKTPEGGIGGRAAAGDVTGVGDLLKPLFQSNIWIRVGEVVLGIILIAVGVARLTNVVPIANKIAKAVA